MPIEIMAARGADTMRYGPCARWASPTHAPATAPGQRPAAGRKPGAHPVQHRRLPDQPQVGEQKRVFSMIPGLEQAEFVRYGVMHRNTFLDAPGC